MKLRKALRKLKVLILHQRATQVAANTLVMGKYHINF